MLVNFAQSQKIEGAACERALPAGVKDTPLDLGEKHSLVIARQAARPLNRREVGRGDRLIFAHGASLRWERYELQVTDNWSILFIFHNLCLAGLGRDARRWRRPKHGVGRRLTGYTPRRAH